MERHFNTAGPGKPDINYVLDPLTRIDLEEIEMLIAQQRYFVMHAPRQSGKTSCLLALRDRLNEQGDYYCVYANVEAGQAMRNNVEEVVKGIVSTIAERTSIVVKNDMPDNLCREVFKEETPTLTLSTYLTRLCKKLDKPLVLMLDEIDALIGDSLISVLRQLRSGYDKRPDCYPQCVILCGVRDVRDYRIAVAGKEVITGGSAFNIKAASLRIGNFSKEEIARLYQMHTDETGQQFADGCLDVVWTATEGQPWLVNALAHEVTYNMRENRDRSVTIIPEMIYRAQERIIYRRDTHIDALLDKLKEERVRRVIGPILANSDSQDDSLMPTDDLQYVIDLGLVVNDKPRRIANAIYREVIPRELTWTTQEGITQQPQWYQRDDGGIDMMKLMPDFQQFFRRNADAWIEKFSYKESGPQLLMQAFLQRIVNGGGYIDREYGLGRCRTDLLITKPLTDQYGGPKQYIVLELKILRSNMEKTIQKGIRQTFEYMDRCGRKDDCEGHFIIFDRSNAKPWEDRIFHRTESYNGYKIEVWGM